MMDRQRINNHRVLTSGASHSHNSDTIRTMVMDTKETTRKGGGLRLSAYSEMNKC